MGEGKRKNEWDGRWAVGIARADGQLRAVMRGQDGEEVLEPLEALLSTGLPSAKSAKRMLETDFASWQKVRFDDYANAFDAPPGDFHQELWSFSSKGLQFFMPALVLMRNVSRPQLKLLPKLFAPQGLDAICSLLDGKVVFNVRLQHSSRMHALVSVVEPYQWLHSYRSTRLMAASIYQEACEGRISLELPVGVARMQVLGELKADCFWVTSVIISTVDTLEEPLHHASGSAMRRYSFCGSHRVDAGPAERRSGFPEVPRLPMRGGLSSVSDAEWAALDARLQHPGKRTVYDRREMLNGVLAKVCSGRPWRAVEYSVGNFVTASRQYSVWRSNRMWDAIVEVISARSQTPSEASEEAARSQEAALASSYLQARVAVLDALTDAERAALLAQCPKPGPHRKYDYGTTLMLILRHVVAKEPLDADRHVGKGIEHAAMFTLSTWKRNGTLDRLVMAFDKICEARQ